MRTDVQKRPFPVMLPETTREWLMKKAKEQDRSLNWLINSILDGQRKADEQATAEAKR